MDQLMSQCPFVKGEASGLSLIHILFSANDIDGMRDYEDIRQVPLEPNRPASGRQNPPVGDSYIGGRPKMCIRDRRKPLYHPRNRG